MLRVVVADVVATAAVSVVQPKAGGANGETQHTASLPLYIDYETALSQRLVPELKDEQDRLFSQFSLFRNKSKEAIDERDRDDFRKIKEDLWLLH